MSVADPIVPARDPAARSRGVRRRGLLIDAGWVAIRPGEDRREKLVRLTDAGAAKLHEARPAWERAQERLRSRLPKGTWSGLLDLLPELTRLADTA